MADYKTRFTGPSIEEGIQKSLDFDPNIIAFQRLASSLADPVDIDTLQTAGNYLVDYYVNGPITIFAIRPIGIYVFTIDNVLYQYCIMGEAVHERHIDATTTRWTNWTTNDTIQVGTTSGTNSALTVSLPNFSLTDFRLIMVKLHVDVATGATLKVNFEDPKPILTLDGKAITTGAKAGAFLLLSFNVDSNAFYLVGGGGSGIDAEYGVIYSGANQVSIPTNITLADAIANTGGAGQLKLKLISTTLSVSSDDGITWVDIDRDKGKISVVSYGAAADQTAIPIGITGFDKATDFLDVYKNGLYLTPSVYTFTDDSTTINVTTPCVAGDVFIFRSTKGCKG